MHVWWHAVGVALAHHPGADGGGAGQRFTGRPARGIVDHAMCALTTGPPGWCADTPAFPLAARGIAPLRAHAEAVGRDDWTPLWAGQAAAAVPVAVRGRADAGIGRGLGPVK